MFGKHGRGGVAGRGSGKRPLPAPVQLNRPAAVGGTRPPIGVSSVARARHGAPGASSASAAAAAAAAAAASAPGRDETFSLKPGELDFGAIIRLTPDLVDEMRRLEAQGGATRIKFDSNANNSAGNVIDVGGKEFRFTWSRELTDLCDIYKERQNGEDGDGLLVECGSAWRKLNVQRILDESTKNHVKMRSEEAERMLKARKAIVLDPTNPSVKNQAKSMVAAAVEGNMRRMSWKHKETFFKKRKVEPNQGAVTVAKPKSIFKSTTASNGNFKGIPSSPVPSPPQQLVPRASLSPAGPGNTLRGDANPGEITPPLNINKEEIEIFEKGMPTGVARGSMQEINGYKRGTTDPPIDLQSMLRTLLSQNPKGMSLKVLEKAVGERIPNSVKKVENVLKNIATFQAPGRYFLKQGGQVESSKRRSESGSSPECSNKHTSKTASVLSVKASDARLNQETELRSKHEEESDLFERIDIMQDTEDPLSGDGKAKDDSKLREGCSSESGSDSDSESDSSDSGSDSGSQSRSRSKSKSPAGSGSSSSDSESDGSSSSKEPSDVDVDIMTSDGEKGVAVQSIEATEPRLSSLPRAWKFDGEHDIIVTNERDQKESAVSPALDLTDFESTYERANSVADTKSLLIDRSAKSFENLEARTVENIDSYLQKSKSRSSADGIDLSPNHSKVMQNQHAPHFGYSDNDKDKIFERKALNKEKNKKDMTGYAQLNNHERVPKTNTKRSYNSEYFQEKLEDAKRTKASNSAEAYFGKVIRASSSENSYYISPERYRHMDQTVKMNNNLQWDEKRKIDLLEERLNEQTTEPSSHNVTDSIVRKKAFDMDKPNKYVEILGRTNKHPETVRGSPESDAFAVKNKLVQDKVSAVKEKPDESGYAPAEYLTKNVKDSILGEKTSSAPEQVNRKSIEGYPSQLSNPDVYGKGNVLRRELSDLELGELREPPGDEMVGDKGQIERKNSFKKMENMVAVSDLNADLNLGKCNENAVSESKKQSSPSSRGGMKEKVLADDSLDLARSQSRLVQPLSRQSARVDFAGSATMAHLDKCAELGGKNEMRMDQLVGAENQASGLKKSAANTLAKDDYRHQGFVGCKNVKDSKSSKSNGLKGSADRGTDGFLIDNGTDSRKSVEFSFDEENALYMKYEKDELDLRGPIKDREKYNEYVQEYQEKYTHYCSLYKKLEKTRKDFLKVGDDLQLASERDMRECDNIVEKLRRMYHQCGDRHKRMKKIFILLHEELKNLKQRIMDFADLHFRE